MARDDCARAAGSGSDLNSARRKTDLVAGAKHASDYLVGCALSGSAKHAGKRARLERWRQRLG